MGSKRTKIQTVTTVVLVTVVCFAPPVKGDYPFRNVSLPWEQRVDNLVSLLTLEEIQPQLARGGAGPNGGPAPAISRLGIGPYSWNTECLSGDVSAGPATSFPMALGMAATFSPELIQRTARATAMEVRAKYNDYTKHGLYGDHRGLSCFSPVVNIMRDPRWGRNQETYGEDPILSGLMATGFIQGLQGDDKRYILTNSGCKHFDVHNGPEDIPVSRFSFDAKVSDVDWQMTFLPAFRACVKAGTYNIMCSYNAINGVPACANKKLLTDILREQLGFNGYVISDQSALERIVTDHHYVSDEVKAAAAVINAGCNMEISSNDVDAVLMHIVDAVKANLTTEDVVRERAKPPFYTRMRLGEFDPPEMNPYSKIDLSVIQSPEHQSLSLEAAKKSFVLLKNDNAFLPLTNRKFNRVAVVGPMSNNPGGLYGDYSPTINLTLTVTPLQGLSQLGQKVTSADGCDDFSCKNYDREKVKDAVTGADIVFVCIGTGSVNEREGRDRSDLELPGKQLQLLQDAVSFSGSSPVVLLLFNAGPLNVTWADEQDAVAAILECFFPAQTTGTALLHVLTNYGGSSSPAARLPSTWYKFASDIPPMVDYAMEGRTYRYFSGTPLYPFGYGLSYSNFSYTDLKAPKSLDPNKDLTIMVTVTNTGQYTSDEVTQVYVSWTTTKFKTPRLQLVAIARTESLAPQQSKTLTITASAENFAVYTNVGWLFPPGVMKVYVGGQQPNQQRTVGSNVLIADVTIKDNQPTFRVVP